MENDDLQAMADSARVDLVQTELEDELTKLRNALDVAEKGLETMLESYSGWDEEQLKVRYSPATVRQVMSANQALTAIKQARGEGCF